MLKPKTGDYFIATTNQLFKIIRINEQKSDCYVITVRNLDECKQHPFYFFFEMESNSRYISKYLGKLSMQQARTAQMLYSKTITGS